MTPRPSIFAVALTLVSGCSPTNVPPELTKAVADSANNLQHLNQQFDELKKANVSLEQRITELEQTNQWHDFIDSASGTAYLTPGSDGYEIVKIDVGVIAASLENVQPYANGTRVTLQFGNPTAANLTGAKATFEWGSVDAKGLAQNDTVKSREITFTETFTAGSWTTVHVILDRVPPAELGFVRVKGFFHQGMSLRRI